MSAPAEAADDRERLAPIGAWQMDYADDSCALRRSFGTPERTVVWEGRAFEPGDKMEITVVSRGMKPVRSGMVAAGFEPGEGALPRQAGRFVSYDSGLAGFTFTGSVANRLVSIESVTTTATRIARPIGSSVDAAAKHLAKKNAGTGVTNGEEVFSSETERFARERATTDFAVDEGLATPLSLETGAMHPAMQAMRQCLDELVTHWGVDVASHRKLTRRVKPLEQSAWAQAVQSDYPVDKLRREESGIVRVRMMIDTAGRPTSCFSQMKGRDDVFEKSACRNLMNSAKFLPALDASGKPIASYYVTSVFYIVN